MEKYNDKVNNINTNTNAFIQSVQAFVINRYEIKTLNKYIAFFDKNAESALSVATAV